MKTVMVFGTFDILHPGHEHLLKEAKKLGDHLVAVVARDSTVQEVKGHLPKNTERERLQNLTMLHLVDKIILGNSGDKHQVIRDEEPDIIALGYDQEFFTEGLEKILAKPIIIVRLNAFHPEKYKSSKLTE